MKKATRLLALALAAGLVLSACGNKGGNTSTSSGGGETEVKTGTYTYHSYSTALGSKWNPHTWDTNADDTILGYTTTPWCKMQVKDSENGVYQWVFEAATEITDVTKDHQDDLTKFNANLNGEDASSVTEGYVYEIKLNPGMAWEDGTPINADTYIYSMKELLNPKMLNYRANLYYDGESAVAGGNAYYYSLKKDLYVAKDYAEAIAADDAFIDVHDFWGAAGYTDADGNECPQYVSVKDETVYGEAQDDAFTGKGLIEEYGQYFEGGDYSLYVVEQNPNYSENANYDDIVGFYKTDDYTVIYVCENYLDYNYFLTSGTSNFLVYEDLYEGGKDTSGTLVTTDYGTIGGGYMSYGPYKIASMEADKQMVYVQNENWYGYEKQADGSLVSMTPYEVDGKNIQRYTTTSIIVDVMTDDAAKQAFLKGDLDTWTPNAEELVTYATSEALYKVDETYTMSFFFNTGLDNLKEMDNSKGNTNSVVLSNVNFRKAMSLAFNRDEYVTATAGYKPAYSLMNNLYHYDIYNDPNSSYRSSEQAMQAICNLYNVEYGSGKAYATLEDAYKSINGFNLTEAKEYFTTAFKELTEAGLYNEGEDIKIRIGFKKGALDSTDNQQMEIFNKQLNAGLEGTGFGKITLEAIGNIEDRYSDVANGEYAIGYGAWGGAAFYPFRNMQVYCDTEQYSIHEAGCWDPAATNLTININGTDVTKTWLEWSRACIGNGDYSTADFDTKLTITATMEEEYLKLYYRIPLAGTTACELCGYKVNYYTDNYNIMYDFGGLELMQYNYNDDEWVEYVASQNGELNYE